MFRNMGLQELLVTACLATALLLATTLNVSAQDGGEECIGTPTVIDQPVVEAVYTIASPTLECSPYDNIFFAPHDLLTLDGKCNNKKFSVRFCCGFDQGCTKTVADILNPDITPDGPASSLLNHRLRQINHDLAVCSQNPPEDTPSPGHPNGFGDMVIAEVQTLKVTSTSGKTTDLVSPIYQSVPVLDKQIVANVKLKFIVCLP